MTNESGDVLFLYRLIKPGVRASHFFLNIIMAAVTKKKVVVVAGMFCLLTRCFRLSQVFEQASEIVLGLEQLLCEFM